MLRSAIWLAIVAHDCKLVESVWFLAFYVKLDYEKGGRPEFWQYFLAVHCAAVCDYGHSLVS